MGSLIGVESSVRRALPTAGSRLLALAHRVGDRVRLLRIPYKHRSKSAARLLATPPSGLPPSVQITSFRNPDSVGRFASLPQAAGLALRIEAPSPAALVRSEGLDVPIAEVPPNKRIQPTSVSSLRSSPAAADPCRSASIVRC
jgi:hypothetical protein